MNVFRCTRMRLCAYLMSKGFLPFNSEVDQDNPKYNIYLFEETPELIAQLITYFSTDCWTARKKSFAQTEDRDDGV